MSQRVCKIELNSLRSGRLDGSSTRKNGRARGRHARREEFRRLIRKVRAFFGQRVMPSTK